MSSTSSATPLQVENVFLLLQGRGEEFAPMERVALTSNGTFQRLLSAFYNAEVRVEIVRNERVGCMQAIGSAEFEREVRILCNEKVMCVAKTRVTLTDESVVELIAKNTIGIGQLFRHLGILPDFQLLNFGRAHIESHGEFGETGGERCTGLWREYVLSAKGIHFRIHEQFSPSLFKQ